MTVERKLPLTNEQYKEDYFARVNYIGQIFLEYESPLTGTEANHFHNPVEKDIVSGFSKKYKLGFDSILTQLVQVLSCDWDIKHKPAGLRGSTRDVPIPEGLPDKVEKVKEQLAAKVFSDEVERKLYLERLEGTLHSHLEGIGPRDVRRKKRDKELDLLLVEITEKLTKTAIG